MSLLKEIVVWISMLLKKFPLLINDSYNFREIITSFRTLPKKKTKKHWLLQQQQKHCLFLRDYLSEIFQTSSVDKSEFLLPNIHRGEKAYKGRGIKEWDLETGANPEDQGFRGLPPQQQNVKAVSIWHCTATTTPHNCCPNWYAEQSHKDGVHSSTVGKQQKQKKSNSLSLAQHHLPALDLFWDSFFVRVQLTSLLLIWPGLLIFW